MKNPALFVLVCTLFPILFGITQLWMSNGSENDRQAVAAFIIALAWLMMAAILGIVQLGLSLNAQPSALFGFDGRSSEHQLELGKYTSADSPNHYQESDNFRRPIEVASKFRKKWESFVAGCFCWVGAFLCWRVGFRYAVQGLRRRFWLWAVASVVLIVVGFHLMFYLTIPVRV